MKMSAIYMFLFTFLSSLSVCAQVQQPAEPRDPSPINGETYYLVNQLSGLQADAGKSTTEEDAPAVQSPRDLTSLTQRWALTRMPSGSWKISNIQSGLCLGSNLRRENISIVQDACAVDSPGQDWTFHYTTNGYYTIRNSMTFLLLSIGWASADAGTALEETPNSSAPLQSQLWLLRPAFFRGDDNGLLGKQEAERLIQNIAFFNDAGTVEDVLQLLKSHGINLIRLRPTPLVIPGTTTPLYATYTLGTSTAIPATCTGNGCHAETDAADLLIAKRAKQLGMSVELSLFFDGASSTAAPDAWSGYTTDQTASAIYTYVKAQIEEYRANGVMPDVVAIGNEVDTGFLGTGLATGASGSPSGAYNSAAFTNFATYQKQGMQAVLDAASDPALGPAIPAPLRCIHTTPAWNISSFFGEVNQNNVPYDLVCQSYYPIYHGPLTSAQAATCNNPSYYETETQNLQSGADTIGKPIFMIEIGEHYENGTGNNDCFYPLTRAGQRQFVLDVQSVLKALPGNLAAGIEWWNATGTAVPEASGAYANNYFPDDIYGLYAWDGLTLFDDADNGNYVDDFSAPTYNTVLPALSAVGGNEDASLSYKLVNVETGGVLEIPETGAGLRTTWDTGLESSRQQWSISSNGDGYFQIVSLTPDKPVLDNQGYVNTGSPVVATTSNSTAGQQWDVVTAGGGTYTLVNRASGLVLGTRTSGAVTTVVQQAANSTNVDWITPASHSQKWRIIPVHIRVLSSIP